MTAGRWTAAYQNAQVVPASQPSDYYVAHLALLPDDPGPTEVTPFSLVSADLCRLSALWRLLLSTQASLHGYANNFHHYNYIAATMARPSHFLITCYAHSFDDEFAAMFNAYLVRTAYLTPNVPLALLERLAGQVVPPIVLATTTECLRRAQALDLPCWLLQEMTAATLNAEIGTRFRTPTRTLTTQEREALQNGTIQAGIEPNIFVATYPAEYDFGESQLDAFPTSGLRLLMPNELLTNNLRRRHLPTEGPEISDHANNIDRLLSVTKMIFGQKLADYLLHNPHGEGAPPLAPGLRNCLDEYSTSRGAQDYDALIQAAAAHATEHPAACDYILCCPALNKRSSAGLFRRNIPDRILNLVYQARSNDYLANAPAGTSRSPQDAADLQELMQFQGAENEYLSTMLSWYALSYRQPVLRTPQLAAGLFGQLRKLRATYDGGNLRAFNRDLQQFTSLLHDAIPVPVQDFLRTTPAASIKLISDLPIEWLSVDGVPLLFQRAVSRMPLTPGNGLLAHYNQCRADLHIGPEEIRRILVLNCLSPNDSLYGAAEYFSTALHNIGIPHRYDIPATVREYAQALKETEPYILVHWGHGSYNRTHDSGHLHIGEERTIVWDLNGASIPPIVMLAACETAAIAETHNTPANAWLALGARSVLATYFPVRADLTTVLFARMFANLFEAVRGRQWLPTWSLVVAKTLALNRYLDYFYGFSEWRHDHGRAEPPREVLLEYTYRWNQGTRDMVAGYHACTTILSEALGHFDQALATDFQYYLATATTIPHTMFFVHLGAPETIRIRKERDDHFEDDSPSLAYWQTRAAQDQ